MNLKTKIKKINEILIKLYVDPKCELDFENTYQLFVATMLSAQTTDKSVNKATPAFFAKFSDFKKLAKAKQADVEKIIQSIGLFRNKSKNLIASAKKTEADFDGKVPKKIEDLMSMPGIGRKSAVVILSNGFKIAVGIAVDTHVKRIVHRLGIVSIDAKTPEKIEQELMNLVPKAEWTNFSHRIIFLGRRICIARKPDCQNCPLTSHCQYFRKLDD